jgi:hypothetical protein
MTRGQESNEVLVVTSETTTEHGEPRAEHPNEVLTSVLRHQGNDLSAHDTQRSALAANQDQLLLANLAEEAKRRIDRLAGPDQRPAIAMLESRADVAAPEQRFRNAELAVNHAEAKRQNESAAHAEFEHARYVLQLATEARTQLDVAVERQAHRENWLQAHPSEHAWLQEITQRHATSVASAAALRAEQLAAAGVTQPSPSTLGKQHAAAIENIAETPNLAPAIKANASRHNTLEPNGLNEMEHEHQARGVPHTPTRSM